MLANEASSFKKRNYKISHSIEVLRKKILLWDKVDLKLLAFMVIEEKVSIWIDISFHVLHHLLLCRSAYVQVNF